VRFGHRDHVAEVVEPGTGGRPVCNGCPLGRSRNASWSLHTSRVVSLAACDHRAWKAGQLMAQLLIAGSLLDRPAGILGVLSISSCGHGTWDAQRATRSSKNSSALREYGSRSPSLITTAWAPRVG
jgi:hypothetical protein